MTPKQQIDRRKWMCSPQVERLFKVLQGGVSDDEPQALFVGGCVRNALLGVDVEDIDIATPIHPDHVIEILERDGIKVIPTGLKHGTVTAIVEDVHFEITTLRHDLETDGRHAVVSFTESWKEDAKRRDFTINTLLLDLLGHVYDPLGQGLDDLNKRLVRFAGEAAQRIEEDHLRILRFFRFSVLYGDGYDSEGLKACENAADKIASLSKERITQEFFKIMASDRPYDVLSVMFEHKILKSFEFSNYDHTFFEHFCTFQARYTLNALSSRLFVFAALDFGNVKTMEELILFPKVFLKDMQAIDGALNLPDLSCDHAVKVSIYTFGRSITAQALKAIEIIQKWDIPDFPVTGEHLKARGMSEGVAMGEELRRLENIWIESGFSDLPDWA